MRRQFLGLVFGYALACLLAYFLFPPFLMSAWLVVPVVLLGFYDMTQVRHTVRRNFPVIGHFRYLLEAVRPEINQYFVESNVDGQPFSREQRSLVYQRAKKVLDTLPFGTQRRVYDPGYEWVNHSLRPIDYSGEMYRVVIGDGNGRRPYSASIFNIGAMSYGALSPTAVLALNGGAKLGGFAHNTGEGGVSPYHLQPGGDLVYQVGTGYFGARADDGSFSPERFAETVRSESIKMIELKLSQGAKPGHGGILPARKVTQEISAIRGVPLGQDVISPPYHRAFSTPKDLLRLIAQMREIAGGRPVGFKLCVGKRREFFAICKAMVETGERPDFITVDGGEGGTGAAPLEFSNSVGTPLREGLVFVHNALTGYGLRQKVRVIATGKVVSGFDLVSLIAIGADLCYAARGMLLALGCIQALRCNSNHCPTGVATQNRDLYRGLDVSDKRVRVANFHHETVRSAGEIMAAMGLSHPSELRPWHIMRRMSRGEVLHYGEIYRYLDEGSLLGRDLPDEYARAVQAASANTFEHVASPLSVAVAARG